MKKLLIVLLTVVLFSITPFSLAACKETHEARTFVKISFSSGHTVRAELFPDQAPKTVENFLRYVNAGFYEGTVFHRIISGFMVQIGGFEERNGYFVQKTPLYDPIEGEFSANGFTQNAISHDTGVLSMARTNDPDSATSQFFICTADRPDLDGLYAAFGKVIDEESFEALKVFDAISTSGNYLIYGTYGYPATDVPTETISITKIEVYGEERGSIK